MIAVGSISGSSILKAGADSQTGNADTLAHSPAAEIHCLTNSLIQIRIDANDNITSDPQEVDFSLALPGGTFTAVAATNVITTSVNHGLALYDPVKFRSTGTAPGGINVGGTFTADASTDIITTGATHGLKVGDEVIFSNSGGALPAGLTAGASYYILTVESTTSFTVSETPGGNIVDMTDAGTGTHSWIPITTYYVLTTPASNTMTVSAVPGGSVLDITTTGTGTHSFQGYRVSGAALTYQYPTTGPSVPVSVKQKRGGTPDDFTKVRHIHAALVPTDPALAASGEAMLKMGDTGEEFGHLSIPLSFTYDPDSVSNPSSFWTGALPVGLTWDTDWPLKVKIREGISNVNLSVIINLLGN